MYEIEEYSRSLLDELIRLHVSDIHFIPLGDRYQLTIRVGGERVTWKHIRTSLALRLISHFKYRSGMNIGEKRKPQSAAFIYPHSSQDYSLRLSTLPANGHESLAIRLLPHTSSHSLHSIPLLDHARRQLLQLSQLHQGLCLFSGPTGSGKTTTLYAVVEQFLREKKKMVVTIEDPIERTIPSIVQVEVNEKAGLTFANVLKASLRHDPDVILIGEIRDEETAALAIRAALTGHVILATIHGSSTVSALLRLIHFGISRSDLAASVRYVISQRLVRLKCHICKEKCSFYCPYYHERRALFDILTGEELIETIFTDNNKVEQRFLNVAKKAWILGYVENEELMRVAYET